MADQTTNTSNATNTKVGPQTAERPNDVTRGGSTYTGRNTDSDAKGAQGQTDRGQTGQSDQSSQSRGPGQNADGLSGQGQRQGNEPQGQGTRQGGEEQGDQTKRSPAQQKGAQPDACGTKPDGCGCG